MAKKRATSTYTRNPNPPKRTLEEGLRSFELLGPPPTPTPEPELPSGTLRGVEHSPEIDKLAKAVVGYQADQTISILKDSEGYNYNYLSLVGLVESIQPELAAHKLAVVQFPVNSGPKALGVVTMLLHESGQYLKAEFVMPLPALTSANVTQMAGAAITYARRYALAAVCRVVADDDTDASYE